MDAISLYEVQLAMTVGMFVLGCVTFLTGVFLLITRAWCRDIKSLTNQTTRLAQKGLAEDVAGLVGNASALLTTINDMVRTATGIGVFLTVVGLALMGLTYWLLLQVR